MNDGTSAGRGTTGLATIALLKVNFDAGRDHLSMFEPFVVDTLAQIDIDGVTVEAVQRAMAERHHLKLPADTLKTLLGRAVKKGYLKREAGRYFGAGTLEKSDLDARRAGIESRQRGLAEAFIDESRQHGHLNADDALAEILKFFELYHVALALDESGVIQAATIGEPGEDAGGSAVAPVAAFLLKHLTEGDEHAATIREMLEGFVLQNALLLKDISTASRRFRNLRVYFDSGLLFHALGHQGAAAEVAARELIGLLRDTGCSVELFEPTIREMRAILAVYEDKIGTAKGRESLHPTPMTRHFLTSHYTPSDIRSKSALLERDLTALGFNIRETPARKAHLTLDEKDLARRLADAPGNENSPRVVHDVDCVAAVVTLRGGREVDSWDDAGAVFLTTSGLTVRNVTEWYASEGGHGVPPIAHYLLLSNIAWLKRPASATDLKLHELVALCAAALRPPRRTWQVFLNYLRKMRDSNEISSDEVSAILADSLIEGLLIEYGVDDDTDAATLAEVVERVRTTYRGEAQSEIADLRGQALAHESEVVRWRLSVEARSRDIARVASWAICLALACSLTAGALVSVVQLIRGGTPRPIVVSLALAPLAIAGLLSVLWGFNLALWRAKLEQRMYDRVMGWMGAEN